MPALGTLTRSVYDVPRVITLPKVSELSYTYTAVDTPDRHDQAIDGKGAIP
ncbi:MAG: hypothetical protein K0S77_2100 [Pseudomonas sp.]|jgi:hypothetical protein|nr:hypothetical protein [Pseudomonas sp.]